MKTLNLLIEIVDFDNIQSWKHSSLNSFIQDRTVTPQLLKLTLFVYKL